MRIKTPFSHKKYRVLSKEYSTRTWGQAIQCWWEWDLLPWFKRLDYIHNKDGNHKLKYRWQIWKNKNQQQ